MIVFESWITTKFIKSVILDFIRALTKAQCSTDAWFYLHL